MALSNRDRVDRMFQIMAPALDDFIAGVIGATDPAAGAHWTVLVSARDSQRGPTAKKTYDPRDPQIQLRMLTEPAITTSVRTGWYPFNETLGRVGESFATELRDARNTWAHHGSISDDDAYRVLDTGERLLTLIGATAEAEQVRKVRQDLRRMTAEKQDRKSLKTVIDNPHGSGGLRPWREVLAPHDDVATGNFPASEFAADLYQVATGHEEDSGYADPTAFFRRTYLTEGLRDLLARSVRRLGGDDNAAPVINLQTNFGGGKTHAMLALWHVAAGLPVKAYPQDLQELLVANVYAAKPVNRVAIVGNHFSPSGVRKPDGTQVNTLWGELAWQLGGRAAYDIVAESDRSRTLPGQALHTLLAQYAPAVILIDEWVAYARALVGRDDLAGGTFDDQFTFAQSLTEAVKATSGVLLAISIPASEGGADSAIATGNAEEVGGSHGLEALKRLQNVVRRVAEQWRPASSVEAYQIVKQRLFTQPDAAALAEIARTAQAFSDLYRQHHGEFPRESRDPAYQDRIKSTYPIHPELFDRLYEAWSALERFQRTRGVLRLMSTVIHALWVGDDAAPMIMPGSIPLAIGDVNTELTQYLHDQWKAVIDADVDGPNSEPARIDVAKPLFGQRSVTKRLARTVFFGAAPTIGTAHKGLELARVFLGTAVPGDQPGNFHSALRQLGDQATYFYAGSGRYWYDLQANITRAAKDQADRLHQDDVFAEIARRLATQDRTRADFARIHVCPDDSAGIPDLPEARLVVLHPRFAHSKGADSPAMDFAKDAVERRGSANRDHRNMLIFLAADSGRRGEQNDGRLAELESAVRDYLGWTYVLDNEADLDLTSNQKSQALARQAAADGTVSSRLVQAFTWALVPCQPDPAGPIKLREVKVDSSRESLAERVSIRLTTDGDLATTHAASAVRIAIDRAARIWDEGHVSLGKLWGLYSRYPYMPRLRDRSVLESGLIAMPLSWSFDAFALATGYDEAKHRYVGLWVPIGTAPVPAMQDSLLLVRPDIALQQLEAEQALTDPSQAGPGAGALHPERGGLGVSPSPSGNPPGRSPATPAPGLTRFFGTKELRSDRLAMDFKDIAEEIVAHFRGPGSGVTVRIELEADNEDGFPEAVVRTVRENATTLGFDQASFEEG